MKTKKPKWMSRYEECAKKTPHMKMNDTAIPVTLSVLPQVLASFRHMKQLIALLKRSLFISISLLFRSNRMDNRRALLVACYVTVLVVIPTQPQQQQAVVFTRQCL